MERGEKIAAFLAIIVLIINAIIVWYGRIHFPINFHPKTVSFFENYMVLCMGELVVSLILIFVALCIMTIISVCCDLIDLFK